MLEIISKIEDFSKIEIITENRTTKPPIFKIVVIEFEILFIIIVPKLKLALLEEISVFTNKVFLLGFQNLNKNPIVREPKIWVKSKIIPIFELQKIEIPTVPKINKGPELFVNASKCSPSVLLIFLSILKLLTILAPVGYPLIVPIIIGKMASPDKLKKVFINFLQYLPKILTMFVQYKSSIPIKKGNKEGTTLVAHKFNPSWAAFILELEKSSKQTIKQIIQIEKMDFLKFKTKTFI